MQRVLGLVSAVALAACTFTGQDGGADDAPTDDEPPLGTPTYLSCAHAQASGLTPSGVYSIDPHDGGKAFSAYCDMETAGGGWTLALKADGSRATFAYDALLWTTATTYNPLSPGHDFAEAKLDTFSRLPAHEILIETTDGGVALTTGLAGAASLLEWFTTTEAQPLATGLAPWIALVPGSLIGECSQTAALNLGDDSYKVRIGLLSEEFDDDYELCDGYQGAVGVGLAVDDSCDSGPDRALSVGSIYDGCDAIVSFAFVYVR